MSEMILLIYTISLVAVTLGDHPITWERDLDAEPSEIIDDGSTRDINYRLPENVIPLEYDVEIDFNFEETLTRPAFSYDGRVTIVVQVVKDDVRQIVLHENVDRITSMSLVTSDNRPVSLVPLEPLTRERQYHFLRINLAETLVVGAKYNLTIGYSSTMNEGPLRRGIWKGHYTDANGNQKTYATTHFQPYNARQAFPCWDEPLFKAVFRLHLNRPASYSAVYTNTVLETSDDLGNGRVRDSFKSTPKMSSYLVTFLVSESFQVIAEDASMKPPVRIIGRSNTAGLANHALRQAVALTKYFDEYFGITYASLHPNMNNDHISSPDWASAGTENWGMVSYRELYLIIDPAQTLMSVEHYATTLISHEIVHKWFGNLVTCFWWSETWINEGFASYFGYIPTNIVFPEYEHEDHFNARYLQNSLTFDSGTGTVPLNHQVNTPAQVTGHFGTISYSKGAAFLRMVSDMITPETFRKACRNFLINNAYEATNQVDLFQAFQQAIAEDGTLNEYVNFNFQNYYNTWVNQAGYPVLNVDIDYESGEMRISQERFFLSASAGTTDQIYPVPITFATESSPTFTSLKPTYMIQTATAVLQKTPGEEWVVFNNLQHGHYRVNYNTRNWQLISEALLNNPESFHYLTRAQIVNDVYALMRSERMSISFGFRILRFLRNEDNYHVWNGALTMFNWYRLRLRHMPENEATFVAHILSTMSNVISTSGYEPKYTDTPTDTMRRQDILHFACNLGHEECVQTSREKFIAFRENNEAVHPSVRRNVFITGIREGDATDFEFLWNRYMQSNYANDQLEMLRALAATKDTVLLNRYLHLTLTDAIRTQDKSTAFNYALQGNPESGFVALQFLINNINDIREIYQADAPNNPVNTVVSNVAAYLDEDGLDEYEYWLRLTQSTSAQFATGISAINSARNNMAWGTANADDIIAATKDGATSIIASATLIALSIVFIKLVN